MATVTKAILKTYFEQGDIPTQGQYVDLIDSQFGLGETGTIQIIQGTISASAAEIEFMKFKKLNLPGAGVADMKVGTTFIIGRTLEVSGSLRVYDVDNEASLEVVGSITASGNIEAAKYHSIGRNLLRYKSNWSASIIGNQHEDTLITGSTIQLGGRLVNGTSTVTNCHVTASANISASGIITAEHFHSSDDAVITDLLTVGRITSTGNSILGEASTDTHTITGHITASSNIIVNGTVDASNSGVIIGKASVMSSFQSSWTNGGTLTTEGRQFKIQYTDLPKMTSLNIYSNEHMIIINANVHSESVIIIQSSTINNSAGTYVALHPHNVHANQFIVIPYLVNELTTIGGNVDFNVIIL
mgnify:FL=1